MAELREPLAIGHEDLAAELYWRRRFGQNGVLAARVPEYRAAGVCAVVSSVFVQPEFLPEGALRIAMGQIGALLSELEGCGGAMRLVRTARELDEAQKVGVIAVVLSLEGAEPLGTDPELLAAFHALGVSVLGLTWNGRNAAADGCGVPGGGLTQFGRTLLAQAARLHMAVDVSHLNDAGFREVLKRFDGPVFASHSNCRALTDHPRNLTDSQIRALAERGGIIGVNQVNFLAALPGSPGTAADLCAHAERLCALAGPEHTGLGLDFSGSYMQSVPKPRAFWDSYAPEDILPDLCAAAALPALLKARGMAQADAAAVAGGSLLRFLRRVLP